MENDSDLHSMVDGVTQAGRRMNRMIEEMLGYALEGGHLQLKKTPVEEIVGEVLDDIRPSIDQSGATVSVRGLPIVVADPDMLYSVVLNLLTNALKFVRPGVTPVVEVEAKRMADRWRFTVSDNGTGIPADRRETIFTLYDRKPGGPRWPRHRISHGPTPRRGTRRKHGRRGF